MLAFTRRSRPLPRPFGWSTLALGLIGLTACAPTPPRPTLTEGPVLPEGFPTASYLQPAPDGRTFAVDPARSEVRILVFRGGRLAHLGHDHVVVSRDVRGYVLLTEDLAGSRFDLALPVDRLVVDPPEARQALGFETEPSEADIAGTHRNMLSEQVLDATRFPFVVLSGRVREGELPAVQVDAAIAIRGRSQTQPVPVEVHIQDARLLASGAFSIRQTDYGIEPFSVLGGALTVQDRVEVRFVVEAERVLAVD